MEWAHLIFHVIVVFHSYTTEAQSGTATTSSPPLETTTLLTDNLTIMFVGFLSAIIFMSLFALFLRHCSSSYTYNCNLISNLFRRGFNRQAINKCPVLVYSAIKEHKIGKTTLECAICLNEFQHKDKIRLLPKCDHVFHQDCIDVWLLSHMNCPVCRSTLTPVPEIAIPIIATTTTTESGREFSEQRQEQSNTVVDKFPFMGSHSTESGHSLPAAWSSKKVCYRSNDKQWSLSIEVSE